MFAVRARAMMLIFGIALLLIAFACPVHARNIVVSPAGGAGVETGINAAIARAADGDTVIVYSGTYPENVKVDRRITLTGVDTGGGMPVIDGGGGWGRGIEITAGNVRVSGFSVMNCSLGINVEGIYDYSITNITISNNVVSDVTEEGINVDYAGGQTITGNTVRGGSMGIRLLTGDNTVADNTVSESTASGIVVYGEMNTITGNTVHHCRAAGISVDKHGHVIEGNNVSYCDMGIDLLGGTNNTITGNTAHKNRDGLHIQDSNDNVITSNNIYGNTRGMWFTSSRNNYIAKNTFYENGEDIHADDSLNDNTLSDNDISDRPASLQPTTQPATHRPTQVPGTGSGEIRKIFDGLFFYGLIIGIAVIVLGIILLSGLAIVVLWDEKRGAKRKK